MGHSWSSLVVVHRVGDPRPACTFPVSGMTQRAQLTMNQSVLDSLGLPSGRAMRPPHSHLWLLMRHRAFHPNEVLPEALLLVPNPS